MKRLKEFLPIYVKGWIVYIITMLLAVALCTMLQPIGESDWHVPLIFVLATLMVSLLTDGYFYGILTAFTGVITANYTFTFPYAQLDFTLSGYPLTFFTMLVISCVVCTLTTRLKIQEKLRRESEKEKVRANLLRAISHDLRTPLTGISGAISAVLEDRVENEQQGREMLETARDDAQWLYGMVENLLSITRMSGGDVNSLNKRDEMLEEVFVEVIAKFKRNNPAVEVSVLVPDEALFVPMDAVLIQQVMANLLNNAVLHGQGTDKIVIKAEEMEREVRIGVTDNGKGISKEMKGHLFDGTDKYTKDSHVDKSRSLGIGLSVCRTIVEAHGGRIDAYNTKEGGACFEFTLPLEGSNYEYQG